VKDIQCPPFHVCLFQHTGYGGHIAPFRFTGSRDLKDQNFNDGTSSIRNNSHQGWCVYEHANYGGISAYVKPGSAYRKHSWWNDRISSLRMVASPGDCSAPG
jgi:peptidase inhibitor family I36